MRIGLPSHCFWCIIEYALINREGLWLVLRAKTRETRSWRPQRVSLRNAVLRLLRRPKYPTGLGWPISWRRTALFALAVAALRILLGALLIHPIHRSLLAARSGAKGLSRSHRSCGCRARVASVDLDLCRLRRRNRIPGLFAEARGGSGGAIKSAF